MGTFSDGSQRAVTNATWTSSDTGLATVSASGLVTTSRAGNVVIKATVGSVSSTAALQITPPVVTSLSISPSTVSAYIGATPPTLTLTATYTDSSRVDMTSSATWSSSNSFIAAVDSSGTLTSARHGYTQVTASVGAQTSNTVPVTVLAYPRYLLTVTDDSRTISRATIDSSTGRTRAEGYGAHFFANTVPSCATTDPGENFLYVTMGDTANINSGDLTIYSIDHATGAITPLSAAPYIVNAPLGCIVFEPSGKFAYTAGPFSNANNELVSFSQNSDGTLTELNAIPLPSELSSVAMDPLGKYLYVASAYIQVGSPAYAYGYSIDSSSGALSAIPGTPFQLSMYSGAFTFHPSGSFVYMSNASSIDAYSMDRTTGKLSLQSTLATCFNPSALMFSPAGDFAYATCSMNTGRDTNSATLESYSVAANGALTHVNSAPADATALGLVIDPTGKFLYTPTSFGTMRNFIVNSTGQASLDRVVGTHVGNSSAVILTGPSPVTYTPAYAFVSTTGDNRITSYSVASDGTFGSFTSIASQAKPFSLTMVPWGTQLIADSQASSSSLTPYLIGANGSLTSETNFGLSVASTAVVMDPSGTQAFDVDSSASGVYTYTTWQPGVWTYDIYGSPPQTLFPTGSTPGPAATDTVGRLIFVGNQGSKSLTVFQHWGTALELFEVTSTYTSPYSNGSPYSLGGATPLAMAVDPTGAFLYVTCDNMTLQVWAIDYVSNGHLSPVASVSLAAIPVALAVDVNSRFLYEADANGIHAYSISSTTGTLTPIALGANAAILNANGIYAEPSGQFLYVTTSTAGTPGSGTILGFQIQSDGTMSPVSFAPLASPNQPSSMTFSTTIQ